MKMELDLTQKPVVASEDEEYINYTICILDALRSKAKEYNDIGGSKVSWQQLKSVFVAGASEEQAENKILSGFARVNMYLRLLDPATVASEFKLASNKRNLKKLIFDFSSHISPNSDDINIAGEDLKKYNLNFNFSSVDELYLEDMRGKAFYVSYL